MFMENGAAPHAAPQHDAPAKAKAGGPKTAEGKRISARNSTAHGLFSRDVVLPHLGEDPAGYEAFLDELIVQLHPKNLLEQHYAEKIAAASWRLRRLQRWQAQLFEDTTLTEDAVLAKLDRVMRHETTLHRQIDTAVKMLGRELPRLFQDRVRQELLRGMNATEQDCREDPFMNEFIAAETRRRLPSRPVPEGFDTARLDNVPAAPTEKCENEPAPAGEGAASPSSKLAGLEGCIVPVRVPEPPVLSRHYPRVCKNEPPPDPPAAGGPRERSEQGGG